jgi:hypothetical protein
MRASDAGCARTFEKGLESFLGEARLLASFDHPALVKVYRFWRGNGTAYMAMPYYPGQTLKDVRLQMLQPPREAWLHGLIAPLLGALELLHAHDVFHRDVAPDNILLLADGRPVLLDFGCARRAVATGSQWFTAHLKPQFAPLEQYSEDESVGQGPWTDLYSLGATLYFVVTGRAPAPSVARAARDTLPALSVAASNSPPSSRPSAPASPPALSPRLLATIDWMLALAPHDRPQDVAIVRRALLGEIVPPRPSRRFPAAPSKAAVPAAEATPAAFSSGGETSPDIAPPPASGRVAACARARRWCSRSPASPPSAGAPSPCRKAARPMRPRCRARPLRCPRRSKRHCRRGPPVIERAPLIVAVPVVASEPAPAPAAVTAQAPVAERAAEPVSARLVEMTPRRPARSPAPRTSGRRGRRSARRRARSRPLNMPPGRPSRRCARPRPAC